ncbi:MAG TPA: signal peptidase I [Solirubrobacteraceae bacterium]|jgi:signal peptidase I
MSPPKEPDSPRSAKASKNYRLQQNPLLAKAAKAPQEAPVEGKGRSRPRAERDSKRGPRSRTHATVELVVIIAVAIGLALLIQAFVVKPYKIPSGSMEPTLKVGQRVLVSRIGMHFGGPKVGAIMVFHPPKEAGNEVCGPQPHMVAPGGSACAVGTEEEDTSNNFIKRVVAGPGDTLYIKEGHAYRNGKRENDPYIRPCGSQQPTCNFPVAITIPPGHWFMMGDNRGNSDDSRFWGSVPTSWIIGEAFFTYWPPDRIGFL